MRRHVRERTLQTDPARGVTRPDLITPLRYERPQHFAASIVRQALINEHSKSKLSIDTAEIPPANMIMRKRIAHSTRLNDQLGCD